MKKYSKYEDDSKKQKHFIQLHEKVLVKYNQMKSKMNKSKSASSLTLLSDDFDYKQNTLYYSHMDIVKSESKLINKEDEQSVDVEELDVSSFHGISGINNIAILKEEQKDTSNSKEEITLDFFEKPEKLNDEVEDTPRSSRRLSFRDKIYFKLAAAKERRRKEELEKNAVKEEKQTRHNKESHMDIIKSESKLINEEDEQSVNVEELDVSLFHGISSINNIDKLKEELKDTSISKLNEVDEEITLDFFEKPEKLNNEVDETPRSSRRLSFRDKINFKLSAAKERRRKEELEKIAVKERKKMSREKLEKYLYNCSTNPKILAKRKNKLATVSVTVLEAKVWEELVVDKSRTFYCRLKLGSEKRKTKSLKSCSAFTISWQELFSLCLYDETDLEISMWDRDNIFIGRCFLDISELEKEKTHKINAIMVEGEAKVKIFILLTVTGIATTEEFVDIDDVNVINNDLLAMSDEYKWYKLKNFLDVGRVCVMVYCAKGLSDKDCFCVVELDNERLQTCTIYKTNRPSWMKLFKFDLTDVTKTIEITVIDEKRYDEIGKVMIPLLNVYNGEKRWYTLKDSTLREKAKGHNPRIFLEIWVAWNIVKASVRVINTKEAKYIKSIPKLDRQTFSRNWSRAKVILTWLQGAKTMARTLFEWESRKWNVIMLSWWLLLCLYCKLWMIPLFLLIPFAYYGREKNFIIEWEKYILSTIYTVKEVEIQIEKSQTLKQKINNIHDIVQMAQNSIGQFATLGEQVKNLFNFTVPYLSFLSIFFILVISLVLLLVPGHVILMIWGIHKFTRKILKPHRIPNNEILDLLSRVPDDETLLNYSEVPLQTLPDEEDTMVDIEDI